MARAHDQNIGGPTARYAGSAEPAPGTWARVKLGIGLVALAALVLFLFQNLQQVDIHFLWFDWTTRMIWALIGAAIAGGIAMAVFATMRRRRRDAA
ncbi:MAG TPA: hypothetical protein VFC53_10740 [Dehalococcoidia bacterium]|nr:hypothetical protein [Dehalococcoidia bacterium]